MTKKQVRKRLMKTFDQPEMAGKALLIGLSIGLIDKKLITAKELNTYVEAAREYIVDEWTKGKSLKELEIDAADMVSDPAEWLGRQGKKNEKP